MEITSVNVKPFEEGKLRAVASIVLDNAFAVHDIKVIQGSEKLFLAMPNKRVPDGEFKDIAHPINAELRRAIEEAVLKKYYAEIEGE